MFAKTALKCLGALPVLVFALALAGCGGGPDGKNSVSGKVTHGGQPVAGTVTFIDGSNKEYASPISPEGKYLIPNLPTGPMKITVKGVPAVPPGPGTKEAMPGVPTASGVAPSPKYAKPDNGLTYDVRAGEQTKDIDLKP
jgi:hypothetical protein